VAYTLVEGGNQGIWIRQVANAASVTDPAGAQSMVDDAIAAWGRLDIVVNNAGIAGSTLAPPPMTELVVATHLLGTANVLRAAMPTLEAAGYGRVVNTSSGSVFGIPHSGDYAAAKTELALVLEKDPSSNSAIFNMARTLAATGDHTAAIRAYEALLAKEPNDVAARYQLGLSYAASGRKNDAVTAMNRALQTDRDATRVAEMRKKLEQIQAH